MITNFVHFDESILTSRRTHHLMEMLLLVFLVKMLALHL